MKRKLCSVLLALCMVLTLLPVSAMADDGAEAGESAPAEVPAASNVAKIGDHEYATLAEAVNAAQNGETVTLLSNVTVTKPIEVTKSMTLDLNGHVLTAATASDRSGHNDVKNSAIWVTAEKVNLTIDGTTAGSGMTMGDTHDTNWMTKVWGFVDLREGSAGSTVTVNGGSYTSSTCASDNYHYTALFTVGSESKLVLNNVIAETDERVVKASACGEVIVSGGTYNITGIDAFLGAAFETKTASFTNMKLTAKYGGCVQVGNNATFENCEIKVTDIRIGEGTHLNCAVAVQYGGTATVKSGIYTAPYAAYVYSSGGTINIENGTFTGVVRADATTDATATINIKNGSFDGEIQKDAGADNETITISGGTFSDLSALDYLAEGATVTVKLAADTTKDVTIPAGATVTLDLNGHKLTNASGHTITNNGKLTVTGNGTVDNVTHGKGALYNKSGATAILNGGTFTRSQEAGTYEPNEGNGNSWYTIQNDGTMTINAGTTVTTRLNDSGKAVGGFSSLIRNGGNAGTAPTLLINGGHFNGGINTVKNDEGGTLTIKGGDFSNTTQYVIMNWNIADIYDGTFEAQSAASAVLFSSSWNGSAGTLNFHGGNVKTTSASQKAIRDYWDKNNKGNVAVSGGIFTVDPTAYVADTHIARKDGDTKFVVVEKANLTAGVYTSDPSSALAPGYVSYKNSDNTYTVYYPVPVTPGNNNNSSSTTTKNPDGSTTTTTTDKTTGTVTETTKNPDGSTTTVVTKKDGSVTETNKTANGSVGTVKTDANGNSEISANISAADVNAAAKKNEPVAAPVSVAPAASPAAAPVIKLSVPASAGEVSVVIPVTNAQQGTVAIKVNPDGTEEIIKTSVVTKDGVVLGVKGSTQIKIVNNDKDFADTVGHWAESDVDFVSARELFTGTAPQTFSPEAATTRGMVVTVLARLAGENTDGGANWYDKGCAWAVTNGVSDGTDPNGTVTREQLAAMLYRYFGSPAVSGSLSFADASSVSEYAHDAMQWCVNNGIINGMDGLLNPQGQATRAQVSAMFARYIRLMSTK